MERCAPTLAEAGEEEVREAEEGVGSGGKGGVQDVPPEEALRLLVQRLPVVVEAAIDDRTVFRAEFERGEPAGVLVVRREVLRHDGLYGFQEEENPCGCSGEIGNRAPKHCRTHAHVQGAAGELQLERSEAQVTSASEGIPCGERRKTGEKREE